MKQTRISALSDKTSTKLPQGAHGPALGSSSPGGRSSGGRSSVAPSAGSESGIGGSAPGLGKAFSGISSRVALRSASASSEYCGLPPACDGQRPQYTFVYGL